VRRLQAAGYSGKATLVKDFVRPLRPRAAGRQPVLRYETAPGEQLQVDWGELVYEQQGATRKLFGFTAILSYSRMRYVVFAKRCDAPSLVRGLLEALAYFGGLPRGAACGCRPPRRRTPGPPDRRSPRGPPPVERVGPAVRCRPQRERDHPAPR
jgi:hypothetical protein